WRFRIALGVLRPKPEPAVATSSSLLKKSRSAPGRNQPHPPRPSLIERLAPAAASLPIGDSIDASSRAEAERHDRPRPDGEDAQHRRGRRPPQAGADLRAPAATRRPGAVDLRRGRPRVPPRRLRLLALARLQLPPGSRRHLRLSLAGPPLQPP